MGPLDYSAIEGGFDESEASSRALQGIGSGSIVPGRRKAPLGTAIFVHVYREFCSCLPRILFMFTANFVHVYHEFNTFRQADSGPTRGGKAPAGPIKNIFSGGELLQSMGGDLGGDGK